MNKELKEYTVGSGGENLTFLKRLERENGWSSSYTERVFEEYKKFIYLCTIANDSLTPSDQVDQVWHLHLTYSRDYWDRFCREVLEKDIHHNPTAGGDDERKKYINDYEKTLAFYKKRFGLELPKDIWPNSNVRFKKDVNGVRIHRSKYIVVSKKYFYLKNFLIVLGIICLFLEYFYFFFFGAALFISSLVMLFFIPRVINHTPQKLRKDSGCGCDTGCSGCGDGCGGCGD